MNKWWRDPALKAAEKKKGPGRGWWGPDKGGTHGAGKNDRRVRDKARLADKKLTPRERHALREGLATDRDVVSVRGRARAGGADEDRRAMSAYGSRVSTDDVAAKLSEATGIDQRAIWQMTNRWSISSNDEYAAQHTQKMAADLFGTETSPWQKKKYSESLNERLSEPDIERSLLDFETPAKIDWSADAGGMIGKYPSGMPYDSHNDATKSVLRAMYQDTQDTFKTAGYKPGETVTVFRGAGQDAASRGEGGRQGLGDTKEYQTNALESWSMDSGVASEFAMMNGGQVFSAEIPVERILSTGNTGFGQVDEREIVVIAGQEPDEYRVVYDSTQDRWWEG